MTPNYFVGIRTPWTLADPEVWRIDAPGRCPLCSSAGGLAAALVSLVVPEDRGWLSPVFR
ncbi:SdpI family protein [Chloroflexus sp.]|uniref:SdpI family protein n=1 Tax=Chloroflexus sp. TaxID=1904827 RepID=UPI00258E4CA3|nr:SdpI family protein [Chloroflexus sp.]